jgi:hypothetical protein
MDNQEDQGYQDWMVCQVKRVMQACLASQRAPSSGQRVTVASQDPLESLAHQVLLAAMDCQDCQE